MSLFLLHLLQNTLCFSTPTIYCIISNNTSSLKTTMMFIIASSFIFSFFTGYLFLIPIGFNLAFFIQLVLFSLIGFLFIPNIERNFSKTLFGTYILIFTSVYLYTSSDVFNSKELAERIGTVSFEENIDKIDEFYYDISDGKVRAVPLETAIQIAKKTLSISTKAETTLGTALEIKESFISIQEVNGDDYWIIPLGYQDFLKQSKYGAIDAYVKVNVNNINAQAELVSKNADGESFAMTNTIGGFFSKNIHRVFANEHKDKIVSQLKFLVDEKWNPYVAFYVVDPVVGMRGYISESVYLYDYKTNSFSQYDSYEELPSWIEIFHDIKTTKKIINDWGSLRKGYKESWFSTFATKLTEYDQGNDMFFVKTKYGRAWFSGMTSSSTSNDSMTNLVFVNTLTGQVSMINHQGSDENGIVAAVQSKLGAESALWLAKTPILYRHSNVEQSIWILPIIDKSTKLVQKFAIVDSEDINNIVFENTLEEALRSFSKGKNSKHTIDSSSEIITIEGYIKVYNLINRNNSTMAYMLIDSGDNIIECHADTHAECLVMATDQYVKFDTYKVNDKQLQIKEIFMGGNK